VLLNIDPTPEPERPHDGGYDRTSELIATLREQLEAERPRPSPGCVPKKSVFGAPQSLGKILPKLRRFVFQKPCRNQNAKSATV
jgi:hypothetical protein